MKFGYHFIQDRQSTIHSKLLGCIDKNATTQSHFCLAEFNDIHSIDKLKIIIQSSKFTSHMNDFDSDSYKLHLCLSIERALLFFCFQTAEQCQRELRYWNSLNYSRYNQIQHYFINLPKLVKHFDVGLSIRMNSMTWLKITDNETHESKRRLESLLSLCAYTISRVTKEDSFIYHTNVLDIDEYKEFTGRKVANLNVLSQILLKDLISLRESTQSRLLIDSQTDVYPVFTTASKTMSTIMTHLETSILTSNSILKSNTQPSFFARKCLKITIGLGITYFATKSIFKFSSSIVAWTRETYQLSTSLFKQWLVEPLLSIYTTIRHKETRLALLGTAALSSDIQSLERMVLDFASDNGVSIQELTQISQQVKQGDLSCVLKRYETDMRRPIWGALNGDLIRALFIQLQKAKVDGEVAMSALDKILKSNEINFAVVTCVPAFLVTFKIGQLLRGVFKANTDKSRGGRLDVMRESLRELEVLLNTGSGEVLYVNHGMLILEIQNLKSLVNGIVSSKRGFFMQDLSDLEKEGSNHRKMNVLSRIYRLID